MSGAKLIGVECNAKDGLGDFKLGKKTRVGFVKSWKFTNCGKELKKDIPVKTPDSPDADVDVVAALTKVDWSGNPGDPMIIAGKFSPDSKSVAHEAFSDPKGGAEFEIELEVWEYCTKATKYFKRLHFDGKALKFAQTKGVTPYIGEDPDQVIQKPENHDFELSLTASSEGGKQQVNCAMKDGANFVREIGNAQKA